MLLMMLLCNLRYKIPKEIPVVFSNGSTYDYHFIIKELAKEFEGQFECLGENTEKYVTFSVSVKKKITKIGKDGSEIMSVKDDQLIFRCFECRNSHKKIFNKDLIKRFANIYEL